VSARSIMMLSNFRSKQSRTKDSLPANDQKSEANTKHMTVAMLSEQPKSLDEPPCILDGGIASLGRITTTDPPASVRLLSHSRP